MDDERRRESICPANMLEPRNTFQKTFERVNIKSTIRFPDLEVPIQKYASPPPQPFRLTTLSLR